MPFLSAEAALVECPHQVLRQGLRGEERPRGMGSVRKRSELTIGPVEACQATRYAQEALALARTLEAHSFVKSFSN